MDVAEQHIGGLKALVSGAPSRSAVLVVHGLGGSAADAAPFAASAARHGRQTVALDLPAGLAPWDCVPAIRQAHADMAQRWDGIGLRATSLGAWFAVQALADRPLVGALLQSPVLDMVGLIEARMAAAGVDEAALRRAGELPGSDGDVLSWRYLTWARQHRVDAWEVATSIIVGERDELLPPPGAWSRSPSARVPA